jgi:hypothetical protein
MKLSDERMLFWTPDTGQPSMPSYMPVPPRGYWAPPGRWATPPNQCLIHPT